MKTFLVVVVGLLVACGGVGEDPAADGESVVDGGDAPADAGAGCGLSFDAAVEAYAPERVCQKTVYDLASGYCTHWVACSSL